MKFATNPYDITHLTVGMLLHYLGKLKIQIFCLHENANKLHYKKLPTFEIRLVNLLAVYPFKYKRFVKILYSWLNTMLIVD